MNAAKDDFAIAARDQFIYFADDTLRRETAAISTHIGNNAERAAMIAAVLNFERGASVLGFSAFDGGDEEFGLREDIAD